MIWARFFYCQRYVLHFIVPLLKANRKFSKFRRIHKKPFPSEATMIHNKKIF